MPGKFPVSGRAVAPRTSPCVSVVVVVVLVPPTPESLVGDAVGAGEGDGVGVGHSVSQAHCPSVTQ